MRSDHLNEETIRLYLIVPHNSYSCKIYVKLFSDLIREMHRSSILHKSYSLIQERDFHEKSSKFFSALKASSMKNWSNLSSRSVDPGSDL